MTSPAGVTRDDWADGEPLDGVVDGPEPEESGTPAAEASVAEPLEGAATQPVAGDATGAAPEGSTGGSRRRLLAVLAAVLVVLLGATAWGTVLWLGDRSEEQAKASALDTARTVGATLTSIGKDTAEQDIQRVVDASTGSFGDLFRSNNQAYVGVLKDGGVTSVGTVDEAGLQSLDGDTARVLVAISSTVRNNTVPEGERRYYRMMIEMQHQEDGRWLVSNVEFVP